MMEIDYADVLIKEATHDDVGRGIGTGSIEVMKKLGGYPAMLLRSREKKKTAAVVWPGFAQDTGYPVLMIDGNIHGNARTGIDERVNIKNQRLCMPKKW